MDATLLNPINSTYSLSTERTVSALVQNADCSFALRFVIKQAHTLASLHCESHTLIDGKSTGHIGSPDQETRWPTA